MTDNSNDKTVTNSSNGATKLTSLSRASSFSKTASIDNPSKIQAIIFTNTDDLENLNAISNNVVDSPAILYENDFDLYSLLKEMIKNKQENDTEQKPPAEVANYNKEQMNQDRRKVIYKNYKKLLTAQLNDISYTDGKAKWLLHTNFNLMYSKNINCIGTSLSDCEHSEPIFLDLQPLSTRIKLMCKLVIIIQGACVERFGPPKLVQDRCFQFDGDSIASSKHTPTAAQNDSPIDNNTNMSKIKSNSCENLVFEATITTTTMTATDSSELISNTMNKENFIYRRKRQDSAPDIIESIDKKSSNDDGADAKNYSKKNYDLENYYRHRMSRYSLKDYASLPYYQYSRRIVKRIDKYTMTDEIFLSDLLTAKREEEFEEIEKRQNVVSEVIDKAKEIVTKVDCSTCTSDLVDNFSLGYFSKAQLMSPYSLFNTKSSLFNSFTNTEHPYEDKNEMKTEYYYSYSKEYYVASKGGQQPITPSPATHVSGLTIQTNDFSSMRQRPTRSNNWSLFNGSNSSASETLEISLNPNSHIQQHASAFRFFPPFKYVQQRPPPIPPRILPSGTQFKVAKF